MHVCGEAAALELMQELASDCGDDLEVRRYERLTTLTALSHAVGTPLSRSSVSLSHLLLS